MKEMWYAQHAVIAKILDGRKASEAMMPELVAKIRALHRPPTLAIIQVGERADSTAFVGAKKAFAGKIGVGARHIQVKENISQKELIDIVREHNAAQDIQGIITQLPLPIHIDRDAVIEATDPRKDADGLTAVNVKKWLEGKGDAIYPATARGIKELFLHYKIPLFGKKVTIVGRSMLVGKPIAAMCLNENATVSVCHSRSSNLAEETKSADIVVSALGKPDFIGKEHLRAGQTVIDVGITRTADGKLVGDVDFEAVKDTVTAITPVPGGVGPMTVFALFENLAQLASS